MYTIESEPAEVTIAGRKFHRLAYGAPRAGLRWRVLMTDARLPRPDIHICRH
jgi:hypothetical protein